MGPRDGEKRFAGFIEERTTSTRHEEPSAALFALGLTGMLVRESIRQQGVPVFHYVLKTREGDVTAEAGEIYALGDCVEVTGKPVAGTSRTFGHDARMTRSSQC